jgi:AcrR family transcriptional regulator
VPQDKASQNTASQNTARPESPPVGGRRAARRAQTKAEIIEAAWQLVRENGLGSLALRELGQMVGMRAQSLYSYFESKTDIYDAMFHQGYVAFEAHMREASGEPINDPRELARQYAHRFFEFCTADPARYQLLFQRTIPDFEPSAESYALAVAVFDNMSEQLAGVGLSSDEAIDTWTAVLTGFTDQQISNDPKGDRWERLLDRAVDMVVDEFSD